VVLHCRAITDIEYTAVKMLAEAEERLRAEGIVLWLTSLNPETAGDDPALEARRAALRRERMLFNLEAAVRKFEDSRLRHSPPAQRCCQAIPSRS